MLSNWSNAWSCLVILFRARALILGDTWVAPYDSGSNYHQQGKNLVISGETRIVCTYGVLILGDTRVAPYDPGSNYYQKGRNKHLCSHLREKT